MHVCIGEGDDNPLQYSCLENPMDGGAWWAAVQGVAQGRTQLKRLSSSSSLCWESWPRDQEKDIQEESASWRYIHVLDCSVASYFL